MKILTYAVASLAAVALPAVAVDYVYFRRIVLPAANIVLYNVLGGGGGEGEEEGDE